MRFATVAILALLVWALPSAGAQAGVPDSSTVAAASQVKKPGLRKALKKCRAIKNVNRRKACVRKARKRFASRPEKPVEPKPGTTWRVDVLDTYFEDYFSPDYLEIKAGDTIEWVWSLDNQNPHNVTVISAPAGINRFDYATANSPSRGYRWSRRIDKPGNWIFGCSLHQYMRLAVKVGK